MQQQITDLEKILYNKHLAISRQQRNKPFQLKKNFDDIVGTSKHTHLKRLSVFVKKHPDINLDVFFAAPYCLYTDVAYFSLEYFASLRAIKSYTMYKKQLFLQDPDSQIEEVKSSLQFIGNFCIKNNIRFYQYSTHMTADLFSWMIHYKENKINIYSMFEFSNIFSLVKTLSEDIQKFFVSDFISQFQMLHARYHNSVKLRPYVSKAFPVLCNFVETELSKPKNSITCKTYE